MGQMPVYKSPWYAFWCQLSFLFLMEWYSTLGWRQLEAFYISWWNWKRERSLVFGTMTAGNVFQSCCCVFVVAVFFVVVVFVVFVERRKMKERESGWLVFGTMTARKVFQSYCCVYCCCCCLCCRCLRCLCREKERESEWLVGIQDDDR